MCLRTNRRRVRKRVNEGDDFEDLAFENFGCDVDDFSKIAESLLKLTPKIETAITKDVINAFVSGNRIIIRGTK